MENQSELAKLFFELASDSRLSILFELRNEALKMQDVARRLDVTATEAFRQLERLSAALLVARKPEGTYVVTTFGKLVMQLFSPLSFVLKYRDYFAAHDVFVLPTQFVNRLGELSGTKLITDTMESINKAERLFMEMKQYGWGMAEGVIPELMGPVMEQQLQKGVKMRFLVPMEKLHANPDRVANLEARGLADVPVIIALSEKEAFVCFRTKERKMDYAAFYGADPLFLNWASDLFLFYWEKGNRI